MTETDTESTCGRCGYCVRGIAGVICPECGSDLRKVGVLPPNGNRRAGWRTKSFLWTLSLAIAAMPVSMALLDAVLPFTQTQTTSRFIFCQAPYLNTIVLLSGSKSSWNRAFLNRSNTAIDSVQLHDQVNNMTLELNLVTGAYSYRNNHGIVGKPSGFDCTVLASWFATAGINSADPRVRRLCDQVCSAIKEIPQGIANRFTYFNDASGYPVGVAHPAFTFTMPDKPNRMIVSLLCVLWIGIWICGILWIHRQARRDQLSLPGELTPATGAQS